MKVVLRTYCSILVNMQKKVGRLTTRPVLLTYFVMIDDAAPVNDKISLAALIAYVVLPIDLLSAKRFPILGWLDEVVS